jgi:hypothetical protein
VRCLGPRCNEEIAPQPRRRGLEKRFCSDRCRKAFSRVVAGDFAAGVSAPPDNSSRRKRSTGEFHQSNTATDAAVDLPLDTTESHDAAKAAGGTHARAYRLWSDIQWHTRYLLDEGYPAAALYAPERKILERAARGEPVAASELDPVLARAEELDRHLSWETLKHYPRRPRKRNENNGF